MLKLYFALLMVALLAPSAHAKSSFGDDITGMYGFLRDGENIQLNVQNGVLDGWVHTYGMQESDRNIEMDRFFQRASLQGNQIYFVTKPLHGAWVEFTGRIERGDVQTRAKEGYYRLIGKLTEYITDAEHNQSARQRDVVFKSQPEDVAAELLKR